MMRRDRLDAFGAAALTGIAALLAFNQVVIVWVNEGLQPVFFAGLRSALATLFVLAWLVLRGRPPRVGPGQAGAGVLMGAVFAAEFLCLFVALDLTTVSRAAVIFYSMPVWLALMAHWGLPGERLTARRMAGLGLAFAGTALAILDGRGAGAGSLAGDLCALGAALGWAGTAFVAKRPVMRAAGPEMQLLWMVAVSAPILLLASLAFGPLIREFRPEHGLWLLFQSGVVVAGGFIAWLWLLSVYPAAIVASFSFLTPVFSVALGWLLLGEALTPGLVVAASLVAAGIVLINRG
ncbi:MAG: DMT family transporter [Paracoccaceae bacterium]|nr:MAG: DMT family transporter [Paracoccaceae bacterium]